MPFALAVVLLMDACGQIPQPTPQLRATVRNGSVRLVDAVEGECLRLLLPGEVSGLRLTPGGPDWEADLALRDERLQITARHEAGRVSLSVLWHEGGTRSLGWKAIVSWGADPYPCRLEPTGEDDGVLQLQLNGACPEVCTALYDRSRDRALRLDGGKLGSLAEQGHYGLAGRASPVEGSSVALLSATVVADFMKERRGIAHFAPIDKTVFSRPQAGWCSWYYFYRNVREEDVVANVRWLGENLRQYGVTWIQVDDGWQAKGSAESEFWRDWRDFDPKFQHGMRWLADQIKSFGFRAGLWLTPYATNAEELVKEHPDWFVRDKPDHYFDSGWIGRYLIDPTHPGARDMYLRGLFKTMTEDWGYDYFKIDGQPPTCNYYRLLQERLHEPMDGAEAYRLGLKVIRETLGPERFLLGCWGTPVEGIGFMNGSRTGGDVAATWRGMMPALDATKRWYFLHNVVWYCDPDCLMVRPPLSLDQAQAWVTLFGITGQHLMLSDNMPHLDVERVDLIKRILPVADVRPVDLYPRSRIDIAHLRVQRSGQWAQTSGGGGDVQPRIITAGDDWSVVAAFNWSERPRVQEVNLKSLGIPASGAGRYVAYDFWARKCLGEVVRSVKLAVAPRSCVLLGLRRWDRRPSLLGLDRHITQGAESLKEYRVRDSASRRILSGTSELLAGEAYGIVFALPPQPRSWRVANVQATCASEQERLGDVVRVILRSDKGGPTAWEVVFEPEDTTKQSMEVPLRLTAQRQRRGLTLRWEPIAVGGAPTVCYYTVWRDGQELARTTRLEAMDWVGGEARYRVTAHDLVGGLLGESDEVKAEAVQVVTVPEPDVYLSDLKPLLSKQDWGELRLDKSVEGNDLTIAGRRFPRGLGTHANSEIVYALPRASGKIVGWCGVDDEKSEGSLVFKIVVDGRVVWQSDLLERGDEAEGFVVPFEGAKELRLIVEDGGDGINCDHADWAGIGIAWNQ